MTGHTGFKGSWLCLVLREFGASVLGLSLPPESRAGAYTMMSPWSGVEEHVVDIRDGGAVKEVVAGFVPEIVFHLAAQALVRRGYREPVMTFETNVLGTLHVLEATRAVNPNAASVIVTSDKVYQEGGRRLMHREGDPLGGNDPYSASKACAELVIDAYRGSHPDARIASARAGNVIGGGDIGEDRLVPDILKALAVGRAIELRNPNAVRPWQHVLDPIHGYILLGQRLIATSTSAGGFPRAVNFGPSATAITVRELTDRFVEVWGTGSWQAEPTNEGPPERQRLQIDASLAKTLLGWEPRLALTTAVEWTVEWHRAAGDPRSARRVAEAQVSRYLDLAG